MRRPAAPLAPSDPGLDVDLDAMLAVELPPCELALDDRPMCGTPAVTLLKLRCLGCGAARQSPLCGPCRDLVLRQSKLDCLDCRGTIVVRGLS